MTGLVEPVPPVPLAELGRVHFVGIGGVGMSGIARIMLARGVQVSGSDSGASAALEELAALGARVHVGHAAGQVGDADTLVISSAIRDGNPELAEARRRGLRVVHRASALASLMSGRRVTAVTGTHGKTTTTSMITTILLETGAGPGYAIGGVLAATGAGAADGPGEDFVAEADESDGSFLMYAPDVAVVTNIEADHLDNYGTESAYRASFTAFAARIKPGGLLITSADDPGAAALAAQARHRGVRVVTFGTAATADYQVTRVATRGMETALTIRRVSPHGNESGTPSTDNSNRRASAPGGGAEASPTIGHQSPRDPQAGTPTADNSKKRDSAASRDPGATDADGSATSSAVASVTGTAVSSPNGLSVPMTRHSDQKSFGSIEVELSIGVPGRHNALNAAAAFAAAVELGTDPALAATALARYLGAARRLEPKGEAGGVRVLDTYAHHPTELAADLRAAREITQSRDKAGAGGTAGPGGTAGTGRVIAVFQPHLYSRTRIFAAELGAALGLADEAVVLDVYAAREDPEPGVTGRLVADAVPGGGAHYVPERAHVPTVVAALARPGDLVLTMGAGDITRMGPLILAELAAAPWLQAQRLEAQRFEAQRLKVQQGAQAAGPAARRPESRQ